MAHLIDKDALVAKIESKRKYAQTLGDNAINSSMQQFYDGMKQGCVDIMSSLDTLEVKEVDLQSEIDRVWDNTSDNFSEYGWKEFEEIAKHFFELGMAVSNPLTVKDIKKIYHLVNEVSDDLGVRAMYVNIYQEALKRFKAQKGE